MGVSLLSQIGLTPGKTRCLSHYFIKILSSFEEAGMRPYADAACARLRFKAGSLELDEIVTEN